MGNTEISRPLVEPDGVSILTMSSLEIARLTGKRHDNILRDARVMAKELGLSLSFEEKSSGNGRPLTVVNLPKRECLILVSGYSTELRARIIDRWMELETAVARQTIEAPSLDMIGKVVAVLMPSMLQTMVAEHLARENLLIRHGVTAKKVWDECHLPQRIRGATVWLGNRLAEMGCSMENGAKADRGNGAVRLFDPDKARMCMKNGLAHQARIWAQERQGQGRLHLVAV